MSRPAQSNAQNHNASTGDTRIDQHLGNVSDTGRVADLPETTHTGISALLVLAFFTAAMER